MTQEELTAEHDRLYKEATAAIHPLIVIHGRPVLSLTIEQERALRDGIALLERVLRINPGNWAAMWLVGKAHERLREFEVALHWFAKAHAIHPAQPDVAREAAIAAMELGRPETAISFCERAIEAAPHDPGLRANLALATLFCGDAVRAAAVASDALRRDPTDAITRRIAEVCQEVIDRKRPCPRHAGDLG